MLVATETFQQLKNQVVKSLFLSFLILFSFVQIKAQTIQVINAKTGQPIEGVLLITESFSTQTDNSGKAKIDNFASDDQILFKHSSYSKFQTEKARIIKQGKIV